MSFSNLLAHAMGVKKFAKLVELFVPDAVSAPKKQREQRVRARGGGDA